MASPYSTKGNAQLALSPLVSLSRSHALEFLLIGAIAIGVLLRVVNCGTYELWYDEVLSVLLSGGQGMLYDSPGDLPVVLADYTALLQVPAESGLGDVAQTIANVLRGVRGDPHPPMFYLGLHLWMRLFGNGDVALRSFVALLSIGAIALFYGLGRQVLGHRGGLLLAALLATNPFYLSHSLNLRMYGAVVLWTGLSAWAMLILMQHQNTKTTEQQSSHRLHQWFWSLVLIGSVTMGLLTHYLFIYFGFILAIVALVVDRRRWWQHWLRLAISGLLFLPWVLWGTLHQLRNRSDVFKQISGASNPIEAMLQHLEDVAKTLGSHLVVGDWTTNLSEPALVGAGLAAIALLAVATVGLARHQEWQLLTLGWLLGIVPLMLALAVDIVTQKFTLGFGWGRAMTFVLPGCLLLIASWIVRATGRWQALIASGLLIIYLTVGAGTFVFRDRDMFHTINAWVQQEPITPTLIVINTHAWGYVLRLAHYIDPTASVQLLASPFPKLITDLKTQLTDKSTLAPRILWLESHTPVWAKPLSESDRSTIHQILSTSCQAQSSHSLSGTMKTDRFTITPYSCRPVS